MSTTYRLRLDVVLGALGLSVVGHALSVLAFFTVGKMLFPAEMTTTLAQHYLMVPLTLFSTIVPLPFALWASAKESVTSSSSSWDTPAAP